MPFDAKVFRVMIASPGDVKEVRGIIREVLAEWNAIHASSRSTVLLPLGWESHATPTMGDRPQAIINKQLLKDADLLVGVFWTRIGTSTGEYQSGTVEEIEEHIAAGKPAMLYFSDEPVPPDSVDPAQYASLRQFKDSCRPRGLYESYSEPSEFRDKFSRQLQLKINHDAFFTSSNIPPISSISMAEPMSLSVEAKTLLLQVSKSRNGDLRCHQLVGGVAILVNGKNYGKHDSPRERAAWESAVDDLERLGFIKPVSFERNMFRVTKEGYAEAERIELQMTTNRSL